MEDPGIMSERSFIIKSFSAFLSIVNCGSPKIDPPKDFNSKIKWYMLGDANVQKR
jgi:hypothetical protein